MPLQRHHPKETAPAEHELEPFQAQARTFWRMKVLNFKKPQLITKHCSSFDTSEKCEWSPSMPIMHTTQVALLNALQRLPTSLEFCRLQLVHKPDFKRGMRHQSMRSTMIRVPQWGRDKAESRLLEITSMQATGCVRLTPRMHTRRSMYRRRQATVSFSTSLKRNGQIPSTLKPNKSSFYEGPEAVCRFFCKRLQNTGSLLRNLF